MDPQASQFEAQARDYVAAQLGPRAPAELRFEALFNEAPLETEGPTALYSFALPPANPQCHDHDPRHYVLSGATSPNYFPAYGLGPDEAYSLHIGTIFMLELEIARVELDLAPPNTLDSLSFFLEQLNPGTRIAEPRLVGLFRSSDTYFGVFSARIDERLLACVGALPLDRGNQSATPGFYERADLPPQVLLRWHLGNLIRHEARAALEGQ